MREVSQNTISGSAECEQCNHFSGRYYSNVTHKPATAQMGEVTSPKYCFKSSVVDYKAFVLCFFIVSILTLT